jgi:Protein of unknown function (DUF1822)
MTGFLSAMLDPNTLDFDRLPVDAVALSPEQSDRALALSQTAPPAQQWQTYLDALAAIGFREWLQDRAPTLDLVAATAEPLQINGFRLWLVTADGDAEVAVPRRALANPAHFYVMVDVWEEQQQVAVSGCLRYDQLPTELGAGEVWVARSAFDPDPSHLLLALRHADPATIALPQAAVAAQTVTAPVRTAPMAQRVTQPVVNLGRWLQGQLDSVAAELAWVLMPPLEMSPAMRSTRDSGDGSMGQLGAVLQMLDHQGITLPPNAQTGYQDLPVAPLRLYIVTGALADGEWSLLAILGPQAGTQMPAETRLSLSDETGVLVEQTLAAQSSYLFGQVVGTMAEQFTVTVHLPNGTNYALPTFMFQPEA